MKIIRSKRRTLALIVESDGQVVVRAPMKLPQAYIDAFVAQKADWIRQKQAEAARRQIASPEQRFVPGGAFLYLGVSYPLQLAKHLSSALALKDSAFLLGESELPRAQVLFERWYKKHARAYLAERLNALASLYGYSYSAMRLSSARTRWGSCSPKGVISLNWRLVMAPPGVIDYVIIHELAHLKEKNHAPRFWAVVEKMMPDYRAPRKWLKDNSSRLRWP